MKRYLNVLSNVTCVDPFGMGFNYSSFDESLE